MTHEATWLWPHNSQAPPIAPEAATSWYDTDQSHDESLLRIKCSSLPSAKWTSGRTRAASRGSSPSPPGMLRPPASRTNEDGSLPPNILGPSLTGTSGSRSSWRKAPII
eukprot:scaffold310381_cov26-Tisochrysis_lutea.AAC.2